MHYARNSYLTLFSIFDLVGGSMHGSIGGVYEEVKSSQAKQASQRTEVISSIVII